MELKNCKFSTKCDFYGCKNLAHYSFSTKGIFKQNLCFCESCLKEMFECISKFQVPKGTQSPFKLNKRLKKDEN